jgi:hypothetical protein
MKGPATLGLLPFSQDIPKPNLQRNQYCSDTESSEAESPLKKRGPYKVDETTDSEATILQFCSDTESSEAGSPLKKRGPYKVDETTDSEATILQFCSDTESSEAGSPLDCQPSGLRVILETSSDESI